MLDYCAEHGITSDVEVIPIQQIHEAYERMIKGQVKYRFVIDIASLKNEASRKLGCLVAGLGLESGVERHRVEMIQVVADSLQCDSDENLYRLGSRIACG
jgi:hypothetical protein